MCLWSCGDARMGEYCFVYRRNIGAVERGIWDAERISLSERVAQMISGSIAHPHYTQQNDRIVDDMSKMPE